MTDPFLLTDEGQLERECAQMRKEIKALREENLRLRLAASSPKAPSLAPSVAESVKSHRPRKTREGGEEGKDSSTTSVAAAALSKQAVADARKYREAAERAALQKAQIEQQYSRLNSQFELFVTAACEREAACKAVFRGAFEELTQERAISAELRELLEKEREQARSAALVRTVVQAPPMPAAAAAAAAAVTAAGAVAAPPLPPELSPSVASTTKNKNKRARATAAIENGVAVPPPVAPGATDAPPKRVREETLSNGGGSDGSLVRRSAGVDTVAAPVPRTVDGQAPPAILDIARGAGALRSSVVSTPAKPAAKPAAPKPRAPRGRPPGKKAPVVSKFDQSMEERRAALAAYRAEAAAQAQTPSERSEATAASPSTTFGADPIADYLRDPTRAAAQALCLHSGSAARLVEYTLLHLRARPWTVAEVWQAVRAVLGLSEEVAAALPAALTEALVAQALVTPALPDATTDAVDHTAEVRTLALALRFTLGQQSRSGPSATEAIVPQQWAALALYDLTVGVLRARRAGRSPEDGPSTKEDRGGIALRLWIVAATHLCGFVEEVARLLQTHMAAEADAVVRLPPSLVRLMTQALLSSCAAADGGEMAAAWCRCCDALGWSRRQLPLEQLAACAANRVQLASKPEQTEALLSLRLIVLYKGFSALQALKEGLHEANLDAVFAELFSYAVIDWNLNDPRDRQWQIVVSFFDDYLQAATEENCYSVRQMVQTAEETHVVVLRALLQLCTASRQAAQEAGGRHLATALTWMQRHLTAAKMVDQGTTGGKVPHPLRDTATGRELASMLTALAPVMVLFIVKGTKYPDQFVVERKLTDTIDVAEEEGAAPPADLTVAQTVCHIQNMRHRVRLMLLSAQELLREMEEGKYTPPESLEETERPAALQAHVDHVYAQLKDTNVLVTDNAYDDIARQLTAWTVKLYPALCSHADGEAAAITALYNLLEDPDVEEDLRLRIYHCRALLDPQWKREECQAEATGALWFCGKRMVGPVSQYAGRNEKSKLTVKVAPRAGPPPSGEPRMHYEDQRTLFQRIREKRETFKTLEDSELRDRVLRQVRTANVVTPAAVSNVTRTDVSVAQLRPIYSQKTETTTDA